MPVVEVNETSLAYEESGTGEPVVLVHGGFSDHRIWEHHREVLGSGFRAVAYSQRHCWPNEPAPPDFGGHFDDDVEDLRQLLEALSAGPAHLVGNSSGGLLCLLLALRAPALVRSLVLLEPFALPFFVTVPPGPLQVVRLAARDPRLAFALVHFAATTLGPAQAAFKRGDLERGLERFARGVIGPGALARMTEARRAQARDNAATFAAQLTRGSFPDLRPDDLRALEIPCLLLAGEHSPRLMRLFSERLAELLQDAERSEIPDASHDMHVDNPDAVADAMLGFLEGRT